MHKIETVYEPHKTFNAILWEGGISFEFEEWMDVLE